MPPGSGGGTGCCLCPLPLLFSSGTELVLIDKTKGGCSGGRSFLLQCRTVQKAEGPDDGSIRIFVMSEVDDILEKEFQGGVIARQATKDEFPTLWIAPDQIIAILRFLNNGIGHPSRMLYDLTALDQEARVHREGQPESWFPILYQLPSFERNAFIRLKVPLSAEPPSVPTATAVWANANWYEREVYDLFGVIFEGHPDLRRILMPVTWEGHPLRKSHPARATEM